MSYLSCVLPVRVRDEMLLANMMRNLLFKAFEGKYNFIESCCPKAIHNIIQGKRARLETVPDHVIKICLRIQNWNKTRWQVTWGWNMCGWKLRNNKYENYLAIEKIVSHPHNLPITVIRQLSNALLPDISHPSHNPHPSMQ